MTFGFETAFVTLEFDRITKGVLRHGRQSQVWRKFDNGWKVVSAHISLVPLTYTDEASLLLQLPIPAAYREGVRVNIERAAAIARPLLDMAMSDTTESAPVFEP